MVDDYAGYKALTAGSITLAYLAHIRHTFFDVLYRQLPVAEDGLRRISNCT